jgi:hypothetical protein
LERLTSGIKLIIFVEVKKRDELREFALRPNLAVIFNKCIKIMSEQILNNLKIMKTAIEEGATIVRVGTEIFGERIYPDSYYWNENKSNI